MTQAASRTRSSTALRRVEAYRKRFGAGHIYLACYATVPLALTPDLLYRLWANFQRDPQGEWLEIPWIAVSDLLLSNLCEEVGEELYEMEDGVREVLLKELRSLGETRLKEVAEFVLAYVEPQLNHPDFDTRDLAEVQQWRSLAYLEPEMAARAIAQRLARLDHGDKSEWLRMARVVEPLAEPLVAFEPLVDYTRGMAAFVRGRSAEALKLLKKALGGNREVEVAGVRLPFPEVGQFTFSKQSWIAFLSRNIFGLDSAKVNEIPDSCQVSFSRGWWFVFRDNNRKIAAQTPMFRGDRVFFNGKLVSRVSFLKLNSEHRFSIDEDSYKVIIRKSLSQPFEIKSYLIKNNNCIQSFTASSGYKMSRLLFEMIFKFIAFYSIFLGTIDFLMSSLRFPILIKIFIGLVILMIGFATITYLISVREIKKIVIVINKLDM